MSTFEVRLRVKQRQEKIEQALNFKVEGESFIDGSPVEWKRIILKHFNKFYDEEITLLQLISLLEDKGIKFNQSKDLVQYPIREYLFYIAKISKKEISFGGDS